MKEVDVRGLSCPEPVIRVKEQLEAGEKELHVLANEAHTVKNIVKFCKTKKKEASVKEVGLEFEIDIK